MGKRGNKAGTVFDSPKGSGRWFAQLPLGPDGKRPRKYAGDGATKEDAERLLRQMHAEHDAGRNLGRKSETVAELLHDDLDTDEALVRPASIRYYRNCAKHVSKRIGAMKAQDVTFEVVQRIANDMHKTGLGPASVRAALARLSNIYDRRPERFPTNPVRWKKLRLRKLKRAERHPLSAYQVRRLIEAADDLESRGNDIRYAPAVWLGALLGPRRGEILGLTWRDVDFKKGEIHIRQQRAEHNGELFGPLKTEESERTIPMGPRLATRLRVHWELLQAERRYRGADWKEHGLVICTEDGSPPRMNVLSDLLSKLERAEHLPHLHPHLLRHTVASQLDELGYSQRVIGDVLGHSGKTPATDHEGKRGTTASYIHARKERLRNAVEALESAILGATEEASEEAV
jgi:integrase